MLKFAVFSSSKGTTLQAIIDSYLAGKMPKLEFLAVISDRSDSQSLIRARAAGLQAYFFDPREFKDAQSYDSFLADFLNRQKIDLVALAGYMRILSPVYFQIFQGKTLNVHPALLPKYGGKGFYGDRVHQAVLEGKESESGVSFHFVDEGIDSGELILQKKCPVREGDSVESLKERVQSLERAFYPQVLNAIAISNGIGARSNNVTKKFF